MTAPLVEASAEAAATALQFQLALAQLGIKAIIAATRLWQRVPANRVGAVADEWVRDATNLVMERRVLARELALSYYRLNRALRTGHTVPDPNRPVPKSVTLGELRQEWRTILEQVGVDPDAATPPRNSPDPSRPTPEGSPPDDDTEIPVEEIEGITDAGDAEEELLADDAEEQSEIVLGAFTESFRKQVESIDADRPSQEVDADRDDAHAKSGSRQVAAIERLVKNGARDTVRSLEGRDSRVIGFVRVSTTGTPCGWCAALISRGLIFYRTEQKASGKTGRSKTVQSGDAEVGDKYHDNCNCIAVPVYSRAQYDSDPTYDLNREYSQLWPQVTRGLSGKAALSAWRRFIRQQQTPITTTQVA